MKTRLFLSILVLLLSFVGYSQDFTVPSSYRLGSKEDYAGYEKEIIEAAKWLVATPMNEQTEKRSTVSQFVIKWVNGSPSVNVEINPTVLDFEKNNPGMLTIYMASSARYVLENNYSTDMRAKHKAALLDMMKVYQSGKGIHKDKKMEKLIKAEEAGKIDEWLDQNLKVDGSH